MTIPQEAIEAVKQRWTWKSMHWPDLATEQITAILTAALPALEQQIREQVAYEIQSMPCVTYTMPNGRSVKVVRRDDAARIARGKGRP